MIRHIAAGANAPLAKQFDRIFNLSVAFTKEESAETASETLLPDSPDLAASQPGDGDRPAGVAETAH